MAETKALKSSKITMKQMLKQLKHLQGETWVNFCQVLAQTKQTEHAVLKQFACAHWNSQTVIMHNCTQSWALCCVSCCVYVCACVCVCYSPSLVSVGGLRTGKQFSFKLNCWYICLLWQRESRRHMEMYNTVFILHWIWWCTDNICISSDLIVTVGLLCA